MNVDDIASIDFETGSRADLKKTGAARYAEDPTTRVLCLSYQLPGCPIRNWREGERFPLDLIDWVREGGKVSGWNVLFEFYIWNAVLRRQVKNQPIPKLALGQLWDTMAIAAYNGLPLSLDMAGQALPFLGIVKDKAGHALMLRMSRPRKRGITPDQDTWWHLDDPAKFSDLCVYCDQDVKTERAILEYLWEPPKRERSIWLMDAETNIRGMLLDQTLADSIQFIADQEMLRLDRKMEKVTKGAVKNTRAVSQLLLWAQARNPAIKSLAKDQLANWIEKLDHKLVNSPTGLASQEYALSEALKIRQEAAKSSVAKVKAMKAFASIADNRMRGLFQYYGAFRTGRDAGRGPQIQNFPRGVVKDQDRLVRAILDGMDPDGFPIFFGVPALDALSSALRACIVAAPGKWFCSYDFSQIEARVTPWLAGSEKLLEVFRQGRDIYVAAASGIYRIPEDQVDGSQRQVGKVSVLALGFGGGVGAFQNMAKVYGLEISDDKADEIKTDWRDANPEIVRFWWDLDRAAIKAVKNPGSVCAVGWLAFKINMQGTVRNLHMRLPSGRDLIYRDVELGINKFDRECVTYMGVDQYTRQWTRIETYGGKWCENATQAVARDVMKSAAMRIWKLKVADQLGPIHDELLFELARRSSAQTVEEEMNRSIPWAPGLPIAADGYVAYRFRK